MARTTNDIDRIVGANVRSCREACGLSQAHCAKKLGISLQQMQSYEKGARRISASRLFDLASLLGVPLQSFYNGIVKYGNNSSKPIQLPQISREALALCHALDRIKDQTMKKKVGEFLLGILKSLPI